MNMGVAFFVTVLLIMGAAAGKKILYQKVYEPIVQENKSWQEARDYCMESLGDLATIKSHEEYDQVERMLDNGVYWLGLRRRPKIDDVYDWIDGPMTYRQVDSEDHPDDELCVRRTNFKGWRNYNCNSRFYFICQTYTAVNVTRCGSAVTPSGHGTSSNGSLGSTSALSTTLMMSSVAFVNTTPKPPSPGDGNTTPMNKTTTPRVIQIPTVSLKDDDNSDAEEETGSDMTTSDYRLSAQALGASSIVFIVIFFAVLLILDINTYIANFKVLKRNLGFK